jgi:exportin-7
MNSIKLQVQSLLINHGPTKLTFLTQKQNTRQRTAFYKTLARLVFIGDYDALLKPFMQPVVTVLNQVSAFHFSNFSKF